MKESYFEFELERMYEAFLNECYEPVDICGFKYDAGHALRLIDEIAFREGFNNWVESEFVEVSGSEGVKWVRGEL